MENNLVLLHNELEIYVLVSLTEFVVEQNQFVLHQSLELSTKL